MSLTLIIITSGGNMNFIHIIDLLFFAILPIGFIAYAIKYAWEDVNTYEVHTDACECMRCQQY